MSRLFDNGRLEDLFSQLLRSVAGEIEKIPEDELLSRSTDDLATEFAALAHVEPLIIHHEVRPVAAIVDRVTFNAHILETGTNSYRLRTTRTRTRRKNT